MSASSSQQTAGSGTGGSSGSPAASTAAPAAAACGAASPTSPPGRVLTLGAGDTGRSFCVKPGTGVLVYLRGTPELKWAALRSSSDSLVLRANGHLALALGVTGGYFVAAQPGVAAITSSRSSCHPAASASPSAGKGTMCGITETFRVTVRVAS